MQKIKFYFNVIRNRVLIYSGTGDIDHFADQIAKHLRTIIITPCSKNWDFILSLSLDQHIDYKTEKFYEPLRCIEFILDTIAQETRESSSDVVKNGSSIFTIIPHYPRTLS